MPLCLWRRPPVCPTLPLSTVSVYLYSYPWFQGNGKEGQKGKAKLALKSIPVVTASPSQFRSWISYCHRMFFLRRPHNAVPSIPEVTSSASRVPVTQSAALSGRQSTMTQGTRMGGKLRPRSLSLVMSPDPPVMQTPSPLLLPIKFARIDNLCCEKETRINWNEGQRAVFRIRNQVSRGKR